MSPVVLDLHQTLNDSAGIIAIIFFRSRQPAINSFSRVARSRISAKAPVVGWYSAAESSHLLSDLSREPPLPPAQSLAHSFLPAARYRSQPDRRIYLLPVTAG